MAFTLIGTGEITYEVIRTCAAVVFQIVIIISVDTRHFKRHHLVYTFYSLTKRVR